MSDQILVEKQDGVAWVTLNRPDARNALSKAVNEELSKLAIELAGDPSVRAIVMTGAGEIAFCAGADLKERRGVPASETGPYVDAISGAIDAWAKIPKPTICALNGSAFGGGLELALAFDLRICVESTELALTEVRLGIMPGAGGTQRLPRLIGVAAAKEMILLGRRVNARRALELGLVNEVVPAAELRATVERILGELKACAPLSVAKAKEAIEQGVDLPIDDALRLERRCYDVTLVSEDRNEGLRAFAERRPPRFEGR